jgi:glycosyltransferase involved in cell wall biosynthesis
VKLRVLHLITRLTVGGSPESTVATVLGLARAGYDCTLAVGLAECDPGTVGAARARGCRIVDVPSLGRERRLASDLAALRDVWRLVRRERPAIVHTHTSKAGFIGRLAARLAGVPAVIHQPHGHIFYGGYYGALETRVYIALERLAARWSDRIVTLTDRGAQEHLARGIGRPSQYVTVPSGVPTAALRAAAPAREAARARLGLGAGDFLVAGLGRLVPVKGFDVLVAAMPALLAAVPGARVAVAGEGPERARLEARARASGVAGRLALLGEIRDVAGFLAAADVLAAPSRNEGMGRALVEAMALGVPVVASAVGGIPDVLAGGECGRLVPPERPDALATALAELGRDPALAEKLREASVAQAERFSTAVSEARMLAVYDALAAARRLR